MSELTDSGTTGERSASPRLSKRIDVSVHVQVHVCTCIYINVQECVIGTCTCI